MDRLDWMIDYLGRLDPRLVERIERILRLIPSVRKEMEKEFDELMGDIEASIKPYQEDFPTYAHLPSEGVEKEQVLAEMEALNELESRRWQEGLVSGAVYHGDQEHINFLNQVYALNSQTNPLHPDVWPSINKYEAEIVSMTANMLGAGGGGDQASSTDEICGTVTSGGTESIMLAIKTYRDWAWDRKGIIHPQMIIPTTAHAAFEKAAEYFKIKLVRIPVDKDFKADIKATKKAINRDTIAIVGSAPSFPHGIIDPIPELSELAMEKGIGFHTDACLGGFLLPWAEKLGYKIPAYDFRLPGVTSISADTHKYGYAAKGTSVILYRGLELRRYQYYTATEWPGGLYFSPTFAGSRPGALSAACWAAMLTIGEQGYLVAARKILETAAWIFQEIENIPDLHVLGEPLWVIAFTSDTLDIYQIMDKMTYKGWSLNGLHKPSCVHLCVTLRHTQPGLAERFIEDLKSSIEEVKLHPVEEGGMAPIYGMAATLPMRGMVSDMLKRYIDTLYKV